MGGRWTLHLLRNLEQNFDIINTFFQKQFQPIRKFSEKLFVFKQIDVNYTLELIGKIDLSPRPTIRYEIVEHLIAHWRHTAGTGLDYRVLWCGLHGNALLMRNTAARLQCCCFLNFPTSLVWCISAHDRWVVMLVHFNLRQVKTINHKTNLTDLPTRHPRLRNLENNFDIIYTFFRNSFIPRALARARADHVIRPTWPATSLATTTLKLLL